jgi:hypothetical protein
VAAAVATGWAALVSYLPVVLVTGFVRFSDDSSTLLGAARLGLAGWLLGHAVPLGTDVGPLALPPLALTGLASWRLVRAGVHVTRAVGAHGRATVDRVLAVAGAVGAWYALLGVLAAALVSAHGPRVDPLRAGVTFAVFGAVAGAAGAVRTTGLAAVLARRTPDAVRDGLRTGLVAALLLLASGAGAAGLAVATGGGQASDMIGAYRTGVAGQAGITALSVGYAPNAAVWAACYLLGPGFALGTDTVVRTTEVTLGALPAVPLLAGLPQGPAGGSGVLLLSIPVLTGICAGWLLARRTHRGAVARGRAPSGWRPLLVAAATAGPVAAVVLGVAAALSGGSLGGGRLAQIGPVGWQVAAVAAVVLAVGASVGAASHRAVSAP